MERDFKFENDIWNSADYIAFEIWKKYGENFESKKTFTLLEKEDIFEAKNIDLWDYPLNEMSHIAFDCDHMNYAIVMFVDEFNCPIYRICEL